MQTIRKSIRAEQIRWRIWFWAACEAFALDKGRHPAFTRVAMTPAPETPPVHAYVE